MFFIIKMIFFFVDAFLLLCFLTCKKQSKYIELSSIILFIPIILINTMLFSLHSLIDVDKWDAFLLIEGADLNLFINVSRLHDGGSPCERETLMNYLYSTRCDLCFVCWWFKCRDIIHPLMFVKRLAKRVQRMACESVLIIFR